MQHMIMWNDEQERGAIVLGIILAIFAAAIGLMNLPVGGR